MRTILFFACLLLTNVVFSQKIVVNNASLEDNRIAVSYDLIEAEEGQLFIIKILSSHDEFKTPLEKVSGDVGEQITPGKGKKILWDYTNEIDELPPDISFRVEQELFVPPPPPVATLFKHNNNKFMVKKYVGKKRPYLIAWRGINAEEMVKIELFKAGQFNMIVNVQKNTGSFAWPIQKIVKNDDDYTIRISALNNPDDFIMSNKFEIGKDKSDGYLGDYGKGFFVATTMSRGKSSEINWENCIEAESVKIELYKNHKFDRLIDKVENTGKYTWQIPSSVDPEEGYQIKITDINDDNDYIISSLFEIKKK